MRERFARRLRRVVKIRAAPSKFLSHKKKESRRRLSSKNTFQLQLEDNAQGNLHDAACVGDVTVLAEGRARNSCVADVDGRQIAAAHNVADAGGRMVQDVEGLAAQLQRQALIHLDVLEQ